MAFTSARCLRFMLIAQYVLPSAVGAISAGRWSIRMIASLSSRISRSTTSVIASPSCVLTFQEDMVRLLHDEDVFEPFSFRFCEAKVVDVQEECFDEEGFVRVGQCVKLEHHVLGEGGGDVGLVSCAAGLCHRSEAECCEGAKRGIHPLCSSAGDAA